MTSGAKKYPHFFKIFLPEQHSYTMKVPKEFLKHLNEDLSSNAVLSCPSSSNQWQVSVLKKGNDVYMQNGWPQFVTDNSLVLHEFLLFTYHGENCFHVQIFGKNGLERLCLKETRQEQAAIPKKSTQTFAGSFPRKSKSCKKDMPFSNKGLNFTGCEAKETRQKQTATPSLVRTKKNIERKFSPGASHLHESKSYQQDLSFSNKASLPKDFPTPQHSIEIESWEAWNLAESFTSCNPHWKHLMTKSNVEDRCILPIATEFARKYIPEAVKQIHIENSKGTFWKVQVNCFKNQNRRYAQLTTGWVNFVRDNKLMRGDTCIFELEEDFHLRVHIFRTRYALS